VGRQTAAARRGEHLQGTVRTFTVKAGPVPTALRGSGGKKKPTKTGQKARSGRNGSANSLRENLKRVTRAGGKVGEKGAAGGGGVGSHAKYA